jgi:hypothetical protein
MRSKIMNYNKIKPTSPDKVKGKLVKYRKGDCLSIDCGNGIYLAVLVSEKFNKFYDFTLIEFLQERKPAVDDFVNGRFFGKYIDSSTIGLFVTTERAMIPCLDVDADERIEKVGSLDLVEDLERGVYFYVKDVAELYQYYVEDIPLRVQKTINVEKYPQLEQTGQRLIEVKHILNPYQQLTEASQNGS